jgi:hypothetical protein
MNNDVGVASDSAFVTIQQDVELENPLQEEVTTFEQMEQELPGPETQELTPEEQTQELLMRVLQALQQIHQSGDSFVAIAVNPDLVDAFTTAFRSLPDEVITPDVRDRLPIVADESVTPLRIITGSELELQFFQQRYGPRENGGNGFLQDMQAALDRERSPVRMNHDFLRMYYLMDLAEKVKPKLYSPSGSEMLQGLSSIRR